MRRFIKRLQSTALAGSLLALAAPSLATTNPPRIHFDYLKSPDAVNFGRVMLESDFMDFQFSSKIPRNDPIRGDPDRKSINTLVARIGPKDDQFSGKLVLGTENQDRIAGFNLSSYGSDDTSNSAPLGKREYLTTEGFVRLRERGDIRLTGLTTYLDTFWNTGWAITPDNDGLNISAGAMYSNSFDRKDFVGGYFGTSDSNLGWSASFERDNQDLFYNLAIGRTLQTRNPGDDQFDTSSTKSYSSLGDLLQGRMKWEHGIQEFTFKYTLAQNPEFPAGDKTTYDRLTGPVGPSILARNRVIAEQVRQQEDFGYLQDRVVNASGIAGSIEVSRERNHHARITPSIGFSSFGWGASWGISVPISNEDNLEHVVSASLNNKHWPVGLAASVKYDPRTEDFQGEAYVRADFSLQN